MTWVKLQKSEVINFSCFVASLSLFFICLFIYNYESSYDKFLPNEEAVYRIESDATGQSSTLRRFKTLPITDHSLRQHIVNYFPHDQVQVARFHRLTPYRLVDNAGSKSIKVSGTLYFVDPNLFDVIGLSFLMGSADKALLEPNSIVLSKKTAEAYFGGQTYHLGDNIHLLSGETLKLRGVFTDVPHNSHMDLTALRPINDRYEIDNSSVNSSAHVKVLKTTDTKTYVKLLKIDSKSFQEFLSVEIPKHMSESFKHLTLVAVPDIHLNANSEFGKPNGNLLQMYAVLSIGIISLLIGTCNLSVWESVSIKQNQTKIALLKSVGYCWHNFITLKLKKVGVYIFFTLLTVNLILFYSFLTLRQNLEFILNFEKVFSWSNLALITFVCAGVVVISIPRLFFLLIFKSPAYIFQKAQSSLSLSTLFLKSLIVFQFALAYILLLSLYQVNSNIDEIKNIDRKLSVENIYEVANVISYGAHDYLSNKSDDLYLAGGLANSSGLIDDYTFSSQVLPGNPGISFPVEFIGERQKKLSVPLQYIDPNFFSFFKIKILAGRALSRDNASDQYDTSKRTYLSSTVPVLISKYASELAGFQNPEAAIGERLILYNNIIGNIVGVADDVYFGRVTEHSQPVIYTSDRSQIKTLYIKTLHPEKVTQLVKPEIEYSIATASIKVKSFVKGIENLTRRDERQRVFILFLCLFASFTLCVSTYNIYVLIIYQSRRAIAIRSVYGFANYDIFMFLSKSLIAPVIMGLILGLVIVLVFNQAVISTEHSIDFFQYSLFFTASFMAFIGLSLCLIFLIVLVLPKEKRVQTLNNLSLTT